jgi:ribosomal protein S10
MNIKTEIKFKSFNITKLSQIIEELKILTHNLELKPVIISLKNKQKKITVLKSPHVHKKARDQYESIVYRKVFTTEGSVVKTKSFLNTLTNEFNADISYHISFCKN